jgi:hypothetical protein
VGRYTDSNAPCATEGCGHYVTNHTWDDSWPKLDGETDTAFSIRWTKMLADDPDGRAERDDAAMDRKKCLAVLGDNSACKCTSYTDPKGKEAMTNGSA